MSDKKSNSWTIPTFDPNRTVEIKVLLRWALATQVIWSLLQVGVTALQIQSSPFIRLDDLVLIAGIIPIVSVFLSILLAYKRSVLLFILCYFFICIFQYIGLSFLRYQNLEEPRPPFDVGMIVNAIVFYGKDFLTSGVVIVLVLLLFATRAKQKIEN